MFSQSTPPWHRRALRITKPNRPSNHHEVHHIPRLSPLSYDGYRGEHHQHLGCCTVIRKTPCETIGPASSLDHRLDTHRSSDALTR
jgi:hypothetical protein